MRRVNIFMGQRPVGNPITISKLYEVFGNVPRYLPLEGGDYNGPQYMFCVDKNVDYESICKRYNYRYYSASELEVEEDRYNKEHELQLSYGTDQSYSLEKICARTCAGICACTDTDECAKCVPDRLMDEIMEIATPVIEEVLNMTEEEMLAFEKEHELISKHT